MSLSQDLRAALRQLARKPLANSAAAATLATSRRLRLLDSTGEALRAYREAEAELQRVSITASASP
jgi:hypothetical protein